MECLVKGMGIEPIGLGFEVPAPALGPSPKRTIMTGTQNAMAISRKSSSLLIFVFIFGRVFFVFVGYVGAAAKRTTHGHINFVAYDRVVGRTITTVLGFLFFHI